MPEFRIAKYDMEDNEKEYKMEFELPGLTKDDVKFEIINNQTVEISGERRTSEKEVEEEYEKKHKTYSRFFQRITLPKNIDVENIDAKMQDGILTVSLPKIELESEKKKIEVQ